MEESESDEEKVNPLDLLYDPKSDDRDANWVGELRRGRESDAVLSCPGCFATLCLDCQQHQSQENRYRAMSVMNCKVKTAEKRNPWKPKTRKQKSRLRNPHESASLPISGSESMRLDTMVLSKEDKETYCAVCCRICNCEVAVYDDEGVYHFFNVLPSAA